MRLHDEAAADTMIQLQIGTNCYTGKENTPDAFVSARTANTEGSWK